jgi:hypothetical protein
MVESRQISRQSVGVGCAVIPEHRNRFCVVEEEK